MFFTHFAFPVVIIALLAAQAPAHADIHSWRDTNGTVHLSNYSQPDLPVFRKSTPKAPVRRNILAPRRRNVTAGRSRRGGRVDNTTGRYDKLIRETARRHGVDYKLVKAVIHAESSFNQRAVSSKGAQGLMQLMPSTARELRVADPFDPRDNVEGGTRYLKQMLRRFRNDISLSLAAYNAGASTVMRYGGVPPYRETQSYIRKVKMLMRRYERDEQSAPPLQPPPRMPVSNRIYHVVKNGRPAVLSTPLP